MTETDSKTEKPSGNQNETYFYNRYHSSRSEVAQYKRCSWNSRTRCFHRTSHPCMAVAADCFDQLMTREEQLRRSKSWFSHNINISIRSASSAVREQFSAIGEKQFSPVFIRCCTVGESPRPAIFASKPDRSVDQSKQDLETRCVICQDTINQKLFLIARLPPVNIWILENSTKCFYIWSVLVPSFWCSISAVYFITMNECYLSTTSAIKSGSRSSLLLSKKRLRAQVSQGFSRAQ